MTKPWEETWNATEYGRVALGGEPGKGGREILCDAYTATPDTPRARLAAQAPAMARLFLEIEWGCSGFVDEGNVRTHWAACPQCFAKKGTGHAADCELASVLRAAGVLP